MRFNPKRWARAATRCAAALLACAAIAPAVAHQVDTDAPLTLKDEGSFFVGGRDLASDTLSTLPQADPNGTVTVEQMYVQYQIPAHAKAPSLVLIHGCCLTGATWETTPDGRMGWAQYFARSGYPVYVIDQAGRGRSAANAVSIGGVRSGRLPPDALPAGFFVGREFAWTLFRFGPKYPQAYPGMQFPLEAQQQFWKQMVPDWAYSMGTPNPTVPSLGQLAARLKKTVLVSHSQSGIYPFQTLASGASGVAAIVAVEPTACPAAAGDVSVYTRVPVLLLYGDFIAQSAWAPRYAACRSFADAVNQAGGHVDVVSTTDLGMHGNTHMMMQDRNNLEIADFITGWVGRNVH
ncbi:hypothetical protein C7405_101774 [Paraburkholderia caballeronis]|uniref:esterase n=1 Tax=Paraburkholderia caballeronis TaxID=416943 RepID=UPI0010DF4C83|nr:esterase [Paraburkholderia caballeronis]TDV39654.1 hypothetical protein C7405_101774 [Paraburkholderia caballeronis]